METKYIRKDDGDNLTQDYCWNVLPLIKNYIEKYPLIEYIHVVFPFGRRVIQKSPKYDEYLMHSHYNWVNIVLIQQEIKKKIMVEPLLYFRENSCEDSYIHMRQILWDGIEIMRKLGGRMSDLELMIGPFYPSLRGMREVDVANISNTTLRCLTEVLSKERPVIYMRGCERMGIGGYGRYLRGIRDYNKNLEIRWVLGRELIKEFMDIWGGDPNNLGEAQKRVSNGINELSCA